MISVQNEVTDKLVKFNRLGLSRFDGDQLNFFEGRVWTRKTSIQLKSSLGQVEPDQTDRTDQPIDKTKSLFSITKSNYRLQSNSDTLTIQLSQIWLIKIMAYHFYLNPFHFYSNSFQSLKFRLYIVCTLKTVIQDSRQYQKVFLNTIGSDSENKK